MISGDVWVIIPIACLTGGAFVLYVIGRFRRIGNAALATLTSLIFAAGLATLVPLFVRAADAASAGAALPVWGSPDAGGVLLRAAPGALVLAGVGMGLGLFSALYAGRYMSHDARYLMYYPLQPLMIAALMGMLMTTDLFNLYLFCELMSVAAYVLVAFRRHTDTAIEAGFKYLMLGSVATLIMLMGIASIYRETGQLTLPLDSAMIGPWTRIGIGCFLVGLGLKSGIVPLHTWLPDAYGRAPSSVSAVLAGIVSKSTLFMLLRVSLGLGFAARDLGLLLILLSFLNMTLGNVLALVQRHTKRLLAYSSIAQTGYVMFALGVGLYYDIPAALQAGFFLLIAHAVLKALAFLSKGVCHFYADTTLVEQLRGTAAEMPLVAITFGIALAGLAGIPPLAGFSAKWFILAETLRAGAWLVYLGVVIFLLNNLLALGYYLPLIARLFAPPRSESRPDGARRQAVSWWMGASLTALSALAVIIGLLPGPWLNWTAWLTVF